MINNTQKAHINGWCENGKILFDNQSKLDNANLLYKDTFLATYFQAGKERQDEIEGLYNNLKKAGSILYSNELKTALNNYVSKGRSLFANPKSTPAERNAIYQYMQQEGLLPIDHQAAKREEDERKRKQEQTEARQKAKEEAEREASRQKAKEEADREARHQREEANSSSYSADDYEREKARRQQERAAGGQRQGQSNSHQEEKKKRSGCGWWIFTLLLIGAIGYFFMIKPLTMSNKKAPSQPTEELKVEEPHEDSSKSKKGSSQKSSRTTTANSSSPSDGTEADPASTEEREKSAADKAKLNSILAQLDEQFSTASGTSIVETCAQYGATDGLTNANRLLRQAERLDPSNAKVKRYRANFNYILKTYNIQL